MHNSYNIIPDHIIGKVLGCSWPGSEREKEGEITDDHHQRLRCGKGVWHSEGSGRGQREKEGHSTEMERDLYKYGHNH